ncbi:BZ3500_MvSof-1268-A1-R1_Chr8-2g10148 [Microbotryum saponariae]|uniref:BZ3500_MvSof-1268-A1-R1_Chr8-2g10148 protein n=1 Tax=Microbotryum saponariae TaxID=289078 RepID=A0A2X0KVE6_9BASI|nr:BZ3500_MvSof-1268-A1-R1_Chr8-2g10148 [Microbotryum saponariae]SDA01878.1 BZ3501_MvSof-1269-A2-R1_Chr8-2g09899 [Microbotryum saponariae]
MNSEKQPQEQYQGQPQGQPYITNQPMGMSGMSVDTLNPLGLARNPEGKRSFNTTCCGTMSKSPGFCIAAACAPCLTFGTNKTKYSALKANQVSTDDGYVGGNCCAFYLMQCIGLGCILDLMLRSDMRERAGIEGSGCGDCMMSCFCSPCSQTQQHLEIVEEERVRIAQLPAGVLRQ